MFLVLIEGSVLYVLDRHYGTGLYRWVYGFTHKDPLPSDQSIGYIYERKAQARFSMAIAIAIAQSGLAFWSGAASPIWAVVYTVCQIPVLMGGFYMGPLLNRLWERRKPILDVVDKLDSGETTLGEEIKHAAERVRSGLGGESIATQAERVLRVVRSEESERTTPDPMLTPDPAQGIRDFTERKR